MQIDFVIYDNISFLRNFHFQREILRYKESKIENVFSELKL